MPVPTSSATRTPASLQTQLVNPHYALAGSTLSRKYSLATFVHESLSLIIVDKSQADADIKWVCIRISDYNIVNIYKLPHSHISLLSLPTFPCPSLHAGDFNCQHTDWGYTTTSIDGECLADWAEANHLALLYNPKE